MDFLLFLFLRKNYCQSLAKMCMLLRTLAHKVKTGLVLMKIQALS